MNGSGRNDRINQVQSTAGQLTAMNEVQVIQENGTALLEYQTYLLSLVAELQKVLDTAEAGNDNDKYEVEILQNPEVGRLHRPEIASLSEKHLDAIRDLKKELMGIEATVDLELLRYTSPANLCSVSQSWADLREHKENISQLLECLTASSIRHYLVSIL